MCAAPPCRSPPSSPRSLPDPVPSPKRKARRWASTFWYGFWLAKTHMEGERLGPRSRTIFLHSQLEKKLKNHPKKTKSQTKQKNPKPTKTNTKTKPNKQTQTVLLHFLFPLHPWSCYGNYFNPFVTQTALILYKQRPWGPVAKFPATRAVLLLPPYINPAALSSCFWAVLLGWRMLLMWLGNAPKARKK